MRRIHDFPPDRRSDLEAYNQVKESLPQLLAQQILRIGQGIEIRQTNDVQKEFVEENREKLEELKEVIKLVQDVLYPVLVGELKRFRVHSSEEELRQHFLSRDFFDRLVVYFGDVSKKGGEYDADEHVTRVHYGSVFDKEGALHLYALVSVIVHEYLHFVSEYEATRYVNVQEDSVHFHPANENMTKRVGYNLGGSFHDLNEAVTERYSLDLLPQVFTAVKKGLPSLKKLNISDKDFDPESYREKRKVLEFIIECLSKYSKADPNMVWEGFKQGLLHGDVLADNDFRRGVKECFGADVFQNFLNYFIERNPAYRVGGDDKTTESRLASLRLRFESNGKKLA